MAETSNEISTTPRAFVCHAFEDKALARQIAHDLHDAGIDTFFDDWEIRAGQSLRRKIDEGLESCTHFVVLLTVTSVTKPWVNAEIDAAFIRKVEGTAVLIPLRYQLDVRQLPPLLRASLSPEITDYQADMKRLIDDIHGISRKPPVQRMRTQTLPAWGAGLRLSPLAAKIAEVFATRSETDDRMILNSMLARSKRPLAPWMTTSRTRSANSRTCAL